MNINLKVVVPINGRIRLYEERAGAEDGAQRMAWKLRIECAGGCVRKMKLLGCNA